MFQYHYLGPDDWVYAARKLTIFQDKPQTMHLCIVIEQNGANTATK